MDSQNVMVWPIVPHGRELHVAPASKKGASGGPVSGGPASMTGWPHATSASFSHDAVSLHEVHGNVALPTW
jgi:hypothetical protein